MAGAPSGCRAARLPCWAYQACVSVCKNNLIQLQTLCTQGDSVQSSAILGVQTLMERPTCLHTGGAHDKTAQTREQPVIPAPCSHDRRQQGWCIRVFVYMAVQAAMQMAQNDSPDAMPALSPLPSCHQRAPIYPELTTTRNMSSNPHKFKDSCTNTHHLLRTTLHVKHEVKTFIQLVM